MKEMPFIFHLFVIRFCCFKTGNIHELLEAFVCNQQHAARANSPWLNSDLECTA